LTVLRKSLKYELHDLNGDSTPVVKGFEERQRRLPAEAPEVELARS
jgi:hypothetical protein